MWLGESPVINSSNSFKSYYMYLEEMTFLEGENEVVSRCELWTLEEFAKIYEALGGHTGSYARLWQTMYLMNSTLDKGIHLLKL